MTPPPSVSPLRDARADLRDALRKLIQAAEKRAVAVIGYGYGSPNAALAQTDIDLAIDEVVATFNDGDTDG